MSNYWSTWDFSYSFDDGTELMKIVSETIERVEELEDKMEKNNKLLNGVINMRLDDWREHEEKMGKSSKGSRGSRGVSSNRRPKKVGRNKSPKSKKDEESTVEFLERIKSELDSKNFKYFIWENEEWTTEE